MVRGRNHQAVATHIIDKDEEAVQHPPHLGDVVLGAACETQRIKLIEQENGPLLLDRVKHLPQLGCGFAQKLGEQGIQPEDEQRQTQFVRERVGGHRLAASGWAQQQQPLTRTQTVLTQPGELLLFLDHPAEADFQRWG
jgi:hypothetical protein